MILVADSGSTNTSWCLIDGPREIFYFDTEGYNPYFVNKDYIFQSLTNHLPENIERKKITNVFFYGAGCFDDKSDIIKNALLQLFPQTKIFAGLDLLGSARSVLGNDPGFVGILGTGTNSCLYDGNKITANIDSLGYLIGDEGSGYYIGKKILGDYIREYMPAPVRKEFFEMYGLTREEIMEKLYSEKLPNRFCAGFTKFISESTSGVSYTHGLVKDAFVDFFDNLVTKYDSYQQYTFNCTGSIGFAFKEILAETASIYKMKTGVILKTPIEGLAKYHTPNP
ncbi:MAG: N-acetylglucosamine kinase [Bacteroidetes bacterium]|nr:N-acetylglucosamine kinase [Bacteroidota bacterium]